MENPIPDMTDIEFLIASIYVVYIKNGVPIEMGHSDELAYWHPSYVSEWEDVLWQR